MLYHEFKNKVVSLLMLKSLTILGIVSVPNNKFSGQH